MTRIPARNRRTFPNRTCRTGQPADNAHRTDLRLTTGADPSAAPSTDVARRVAMVTAARPLGTQTSQGLLFCEAYVAEDLVLQTARSLAHEIGLSAVTPGAGATLR